MVLLGSRKIDMTKVTITMCMNIESRCTIDYIHEDNTNSGHAGEVVGFITPIEQQTFSPPFVCFSVY